jgi:thioester reductase-like protein
MARAANVASLRELLSIATSHKPKTFNYISTLSIFQASPKGPSRVVHEYTETDSEEHRNSQGYTASKWVGERFIMEASRRGIPCNIFRLGLIWADAKGGRYDELQREYRLLKSCLMSGYGIQDYEFELPPTPVDYVARAIVFLANAHANGQGIFHLSSPYPSFKGLFQRCKDMLGTPRELFPEYQWIGKMRRLHYEGHTLPITPLIEATFAMDETAFQEYQRARRMVGTTVDSTRTQRELEASDIVAPTVTDNMLYRHLEDILERDPDLQRLLAHKQRSESRRTA